jgi:predicted amidohydrolase
MSEPKSRREAMVRVACIQMEPVVGEKERNVSHTLSLIGKAADNGAKLVVLPELCNSGYMFATREEAFKLAE